MFQWTFKHDISIKLMFVAVCCCCLLFSEHAEAKWCSVRVHELVLSWNVSLAVNCVFI